VEEGPIGEVASCDLDLHQVNKPIAAGDRDASHARREVKLHRRLCSPTSTRKATTTLLPIPDSTGLDAPTFANGPKIPTIRSQPTPTMTPSEYRSISLGFSAQDSVSCWSFIRPHWRLTNGLLRTQSLI
jgi:hypothetical protein